MRVGIGEFELSPLLCQNLNVAQLIETQRYRPHCMRRITQEFGLIGPLLDTKRQVMRIDVV